MSMKCENCGGILELEDEFCRHCGQPNRQGQKHAQDMRRFQGEFEETKAIVEEKTKSYSELVVRVIMLSVLIIASIVTILMAGLADSTVYSRKAKLANKSYKEYSAKMDQMLENEEFLEYAAFVQEKNIRMYDTPYEAKYEQITRIAQNYAYAYEAILRMGFPSDYLDVVKQAKYAGDSLTSFYRACERRIETADEVKEPRDWEQEQKMVDCMQRNTELLLVTYCGFTEEEAASLPTLSEAKLAVLFEEKAEALANEE